MAKSQSNASSQPKATKGRGKGDFLWVGEPIRGREGVEAVPSPPISGESWGAAGSRGQTRPHTLPRAALTYNWAAPETLRTRFTSARWMQSTHGAGDQPGTGEQLGCTSATYLADVKRVRRVSGAAQLYVSAARGRVCGRVWPRLPAAPQLSPDIGGEGTASTPSRPLMGSPTHRKSPDVILTHRQLRTGAKLGKGKPVANNTVPPPHENDAALPPPEAPVPTANNTNYRDEEIRNLLDKLAKIKPYTDEGWEKLKDKKKPTGRSAANQFHELALECEREICGMTAMFEIDDAHADDEDVGLTDLEAKLIKKEQKPIKLSRHDSPEWTNQGDTDLIQISSSDSDEVEIVQSAKVSPAAAYVGASSKKGKRKALANLPVQRATQIPRREPATALPGHVSTSHLTNGIDRIAANTSPEVENALNDCRHADNMSQIHYASLTEEVRSLRAQLDSERDRRITIQNELQIYKFREEMRQVVAPVAPIAPAPPIVPVPPASMAIPITNVAPVLDVLAAPVLPVASVNPVVSDV
ncbi:hypothetical protein FRC09_012794 [Ceratobasidium sp. 395]|nr:hypothetical protein FRC09_012794 [Ceratobasidium sp. 395]